MIQKLNISPRIILMEYFRKRYFGKKKKKFERNRWNPIVKKKQGESKCMIFQSNRIRILNCWNGLNLSDNFSRYFFFFFLCTGLPHYHHTNGCIIVSVATCIQFIVILVCIDTYNGNFDQSIVRTQNTLKLFVVLTWKTKTIVFYFIF